MVDGHEQKPMDGVSLAYTFDDPDEPGRKTVQYFENNASRGIYRDGWYACAFGPFVPWDTASTAKRLADLGRQDRAVGALRPAEDFSQANDLAADQPEKLERTQGAVQRGVARQPGVADRRRAVAAHPSRGPHRLAVHADGGSTRPCTRMPEFTAPGLGRQDSHVEIELTVPDNASGVLYALGGFSGGLTLFMDNGYLVYEYNMLIIDRYQARSAAPDRRWLARHHRRHRVRSPKPMAPAMVTLAVDGAEVAHGRGGAHRSRGVHRQRNIRRRSRPGLAGVARLLRPAAVPVHGTIDCVDVEVFPPGKNG